MLIRLTYAVSDQPAVVITDTWPSTWAAIEWAQQRGALVASAVKVKP